MLAELLVAGFARLAGAAGIDETADPDGVASLPLSDFASDLHHLAHDFVARHHGKNFAAPLGPHLVNVRVANPAIKDVNQDIVRAGFAPLNGERSQRRLW